MKNNKKGQGTASTFLIASIIFISILSIIGIMISHLSNDYSVDSIDYFDKYQGEYNNITSVGTDFAGGIDISANETAPDVDRYEDISFYKALKIVGKTPKILTSITSGLYKMSADIGIPVEFIYLLTSILAIILIALVIKIFRGFDNV